MLRAYYSDVRWANWGRVFGFEAWGISQMQMMFIMLDDTHFPRHQRLLVYRGLPLAFSNSRVFEEPFKTNVRHNSV